MDNRNTLLYKISLFSLAFAAVVVLLGAYTRLVDAGLGCPDWPGCYGFLTVPDEHHEIKAAEEAYPHAPVESHKAWPEMIHRYFAGSLGLLVAAIAVIAFATRKKGDHPVVLPIVLLGVICFQAALGMWTVTMGLLPIIVMGHLLGGFTMLALLLLLVLILREGSTFNINSPLSKLVLLGIIIATLQITLGGWTSANYAAIICEDFPTCQGHWIPPMDFASAFQIRTEGVTNYLGGHLGNDARVTIQWMHRLGALITTVFIIFLHVKLLKAGYKKLAIWLIGVLTLQVILGISNVVFSLPLAIAVAHNGVAALLLLSLVYILHQISIDKRSDD